MRPAEAWTIQAVHAAAIAATPSQPATEVERANRGVATAGASEYPVFFVRSFIAWVHGVAIGLGGPGLFVIAFLDSSFISLPQINDLLVVLMVTQHKEWMAYYAAMATFGSLAGCSVIYYLAARGGDAFLRRRVRTGALDRTLAAYKRHGLLALMVPALLPPPAPFKLFVLAAGLAQVPPLQFAIAIVVARGARYVALGVLAIYYGDAALELMRTQGRVVALGLAGVLVAAAVAWWLFQRRHRARQLHG
jgi:membrane protein YqaA with SNARE-associated domain